MGDMAEVFNTMKEHSKEKRANNREASATRKVRINGVMWSAPREVVDEVDRLVDEVAGMSEKLLAHKGFVRRVEKQASEVQRLTAEIGQWLAFAENLMMQYDNMQIELPDHVVDEVQNLLTTKNSEQDSGE